MAKRFIDTGMFDDNWFMDLSKDSKLLYLYVITKCSHAGLIEFNERLCKFQTGISDLKGAVKGLGNRLITVKEGFFFVPKFLFFQYPNFPNSNVFQQKTALEELTKLGLFKDGKLTPLEGLFNPYVDDSVNVTVNVNAKPEKPELIYPFTDVGFMQAWEVWREYKKEQFSFTYKPKGEQAALKDIGELANGDMAKAISIIQQSMAKGWKGFFDIRSGNMVDSEMDSYKRELIERATK